MIAVLKEAIISMPSNDLKRIMEQIGASEDSDRLIEVSTTACTGLHYTMLRNTTFAADFCFAKSYPFAIHSPGIQL